MYFRDVATGKLPQGRPPVGGRVGLDQHASPGTLCLGQGRVQVGRLVAGLLSPVRVWEMAIRHEDGDVAERRRDADPPVGIAGPADLDPGRLRIITRAGAA